MSNTLNAIEIHRRHMTDGFWHDDCPFCPLAGAVGEEAASMTRPVPDAVPRTPVASNQRRAERVAAKSCWRSLPQPDTEND